ncbi:MAG: dihydroorotate dehydrogenase-like protein [Bacteroidales bacterium]
MAELKTNYLGLELNNPIVVGASNLVTDHQTLKKIEEAGAGAIVYKSLFEEQIQLERVQQDDFKEVYSHRHPEMISIFPDIKHAGPDEFLLNFKNAIREVNIPVIASLNCVYDVTWTEYAKKLEDAGASALELNFYANPRDAETKGKEIVEQQLAILKKIKQSLSIPVSVKLSPFYTNILAVVTEMDRTGVDGFVLFNRLFQPDIDIDKEEMVFPWHLSHDGDARLPLRYTGMLAGEIKADIAANTGILTGRDAIQMMLAGADVVQVVTTLYKNGIGQIKSMTSDISQWMDKKGYATINDFKGKLSRKSINDPFAYKRAQYVDILMKSEEIFSKYPMR